MKTFATVFLGVAAIVVGWNFYQDTFREEESKLEELHATVDIHGMNCAKTENLYDHTWMKCRYPGTSQNEPMGTVWVLHEDEQGPVWITRNSGAIRVIDRYAKLPSDVQSQVPRIRRNTLEENNEMGLNSIPSVPWEHLD